MIFIVSYFFPYSLFYLAHESLPTWFLTAPLFPFTLIFALVFYLPTTYFKGTWEISWLLWVSYMNRQIWGFKTYKSKTRMLVSLLLCGLPCFIHDVCLHFFPLTFKFHFFFFGNNWVGSHCVNVLNFHCVPIRWLIRDYFHFQVIVNKVIWMSRDLCSRI